MKPKLPVIIIGSIVVLLVLVIGLIWQKSQVKTTPPASPTAEVPTVNKVDLSTQPEWVQSLDITVKKGISGNGLPNVTVTVKGMPAGLVQSVSYVIQYQTTNAGAQGALSSTPVNVSGATTFTKTIDLGTCSTKSCIRHEGVTAVDLELDFTTTSGDKPIWSKTLSL
ncbi:hypothetical protein HY440_03495 [Candidatus Microgenomates bacterium]|nr:hypothetical protein [Candidatus Microgenomates bacterium]